MNKLEKSQNELSIIENKTRELQTDYIKELDSNPKYSLAVDPTNQYQMSEEQKRFVKNYVEYKSIMAAAEYTGIDMDTAKAYYVSYSSQQEIRRINLALYQRQFATRLVSLDEIGGYLTSLLTDLNVPIADQLKPTEKLKVVQMLIDLNKMKIEAMQDPSIVMAKDIDIQIKNLSVATIQDLLHQDEKMSKKKDIIYDMTDDDTTMEEKAYLSTLPTEQLLELIEETNKKEKK